MGASMIGLITIVLLFIAIFAGIHIALALGIVSMVGVWWVTGNLDIALKLIGTTAYTAVNDYALGCTPMFLLMGLLANLSGASDELYDAAQIIFRRVRGGIAMATVFANAVFASISATSVASAAVFTKIAVPQMDRLGYQRRFSLGTVAGSSIIGMLIPPSYYFIIYGIITQESIGKLFLAGIGPGVLLSIVYISGISFMGFLHPEMMGQKAQQKTKLSPGDFYTLIRPWPVVCIVILVLGGIYGGIFTPTEAGAAGCTGALLLTILKGRLTRSGLWEVIMETGYATSSIYFLITAAGMYSRMLTFSGMPNQVSMYIASLHLTPLIVIALFCLVFLILGTFIDGTSIMLLAIPLMLPVVKALNLDLIWFGVVTVFCCEMGLLTPPFGLVVFVVKSVVDFECSVEDIFIGSMPFLLMMLLVLIVLIFFPALSIWIPSKMF
jgi:C4-dicarboxylate transporter, DctM subunit